MSDSRDNKDYGDFRAFQDYETSRDDASPTPLPPQTAESTQTAESAPPADSAQSLFATLFPENADSTQTSQNAPPSARRDASADKPNVFAQFLFHSLKYGIILAIFGGGGFCRALKDSNRYDRPDRSTFPRGVDVPPERTDPDASSPSENKPRRSIDELNERMELSRRFDAPIVDGKPDVDAIRNGDLGRLLSEKASEAGEWSQAPVPKLRASQDANWRDDAERPGGTLQTLTLYDGDSSRNVELRFRWIPAGTFLYGSQLDESDRDANDAVQPQATVERGFWLLETETTEKIVFRLATKSSSPLRSNPWLNALNASSLPLVSSLARAARPLLFAFPARVDAEEARRFCEQLNSLEGKPDGCEFRLPTEAEWERACRAGTTTPFNVGEELTFRDAVFAEPDVPYRSSGPGNVGLFKPNAWGLYDMHGNLDEWTTAVENAPAAENSDASDAEPTFVLRGGSYNSTADACASSAREVVASNADALRNAGFRIALVPVDAETETPESLRLDALFDPSLNEPETESTESPETSEAATGAE